MVPGGQAFGKGSRHVVGLYSLRERWASRTRAPSRAKMATMSYPKDAPCVKQLVPQQVSYGICVGRHAGLHEDEVVFPESKTNPKAKSS